MRQTKVDRERHMQTLHRVNTFSHLFCRLKHTGVWSRFFPVTTSLGCLGIWPQTSLYCGFLITWRLCEAFQPSRSHSRVCISYFYCWFNNKFNVVVLSRHLVNATRALFCGHSTTVQWPLHLWLFTYCKSFTPPHPRQNRRSDIRTPVTRRVFIPLFFFLFIIALRYRYIDFKSGQLGWRRKAAEVKELFRLVKQSKAHGGQKCRPVPHEIFLTWRGGLSLPSPGLEIRRRIVEDGVAGVAMVPQQEEGRIEGSEAGAKPREQKATCWGDKCQQKIPIAAERH